MNLLKSIFFGALVGFGSVMLHNFASPFGLIASLILTYLGIRIIKDKFTNRSRGFAIVEMSDDSAANAAIAALHEKEFMERALVVNEARPREDNGGNRGGGGFNRGGNGGGGNSGGYNKRY